MSCPEGRVQLRTLPSPSSYDSRSHLSPCAFAHGSFHPNTPDRFARDEVLTRCPLDSILSRPGPSFAEARHAETRHDELKHSHQQWRASAGPVNLYDYIHGMHNDAVIAAR